MRNFLILLPLLFTTIPAMGVDATYIRPGTKLISTDGTKVMTLASGAFLISKQEMDRLMEHVNKASESRRVLLEELSKVKKKSREQKNIADRALRKAEKNSWIKLGIGVLSGIVVKQVKF